MLSFPLSITWPFLLVKSGASVARRQQSMRATRQATIKQVASEARVSTQTVSRVINGRPDVSPETRMRVLEVVERLSYRPSAVARSLIGRRTYTIGVVASGLQYFGPSSTLTGI